MPHDDPIFLTAALGWLFVVGSTVGSFLNVVVYRLPAGLSLLFPSSHCPACKTPIRLRDNVPIFGWLILRGRCRDCGVHISARYPLVEMATAVIFVVLAWFEPLSNDLNLPWVGFLRARPAVGQHELGLAGIWGIYAFHLFLLCSLLTATLIEYDGMRPPARMVIIPLLVGLIAPIVWPWLKPSSAVLADSGILPQLADAAWSLACSAVLALVIFLESTGKSAAKASAVFPFAVLTWTGIFLGVRACFVPATVAAVLFLVAAILARRWPRLDRIPWSGWFSLLVFVWLIKWTALDAILSAITSTRGFFLDLALLPLVGALSWLAAKIRIGNFQRRCGM